MRPGRTMVISVCLIVISVNALSLIVDGTSTQPSGPMAPGWAQQNANTGRTFFAVDFLNTTFGIAVGDKGGDPNAVVRLTKNGGANWNAPTTSPTFPLFGLDVHENPGPVIETLAWTAGSGGGIAGSKDGGQNWNNLRNPGSPNDNLMGVQFINATLGWVVGVIMEGGQPTQILGTTDGGLTWDPQLQEDQIGMNALSFVDDLHGWTVGLTFSGNNGRIYNTSDGGASWTQQPLAVSVSPLTDVEFMDQWTGYAVGFNGAFLNTSDGGATWKSKQIVNGVNFNSLDFVNGNQGWTVGTNGNIYVTYDGGVTWSKQTSPLNQGFNGVSFANAMKGWAAGSNGAMINTSDGGGIPADKTPPVVNITEPADKSIVNGTVTIKVNATDNVGVTKVSVAIDGVVRWNATAAPYNFSWNTSNENDGVHAINATGFDSAGNQGYDEITVTTANRPKDIEPPKVNITFPSNGAKVSGNITITVNATDDVSVANVTVLIDGNLLGIDATAPYEFPWNTTQIADGMHTINATAKDASGNEGYDEIAVLVLNTPDNPPNVNITSPKNGETVSATISIQANATDDKGITHVDFLVDGALIGTDTTSPYSLDWDTTTVKNGTHGLNVTAHDSVGQVAYDEIAVNVDNVIVPDKTPPQVAITSPADKSTVSGSVSIKAIAMDNIKVSRVEFSIDGNLKGTDTSVPYEMAWDTTKYTLGAHTITATAYDPSSNKASDTITVTVVEHKDLPPTAKILSPKNGSTVAKSATIVIDAKDDVGIKYVSVSIDGGEVANLTSAPFTQVWDTTASSNGEHKISTVVVDTASQSSTDAVTVKVDNAAPSVGGSWAIDQGIPLWIVLALIVLIILLILALVMSRKRRVQGSEESAPPPLTFERGQEKEGKNVKTEEQPGPETRSDPSKESGYESKEDAKGAVAPGPSAQGAVEREVM